MSVAVRERLKTMLLLLSSDHEGERQAATAGIARVLKAPNRDFHDLALLDGPEPPPPLIRRPRRRHHPYCGHAVTVILADGVRSASGPTAAA